MFVFLAASRAALQDSTIVGVPMPAELSALYRDLMSPYCPGLSLASCPSPQADSLRKAIAVRFENGESPRDITTALVADYGSDIRGSPSMDGFGAMAFIVPVLLLIGGALMAQRWLRRNVRRQSLPLVALMCALPLIGCADAERSQPEDSTAVVAEAPVRATPWATGAWMRAGAAGATTGAYAIVHNPHRDSLQIVGVTAAVADTVEIHETTLREGMMHMTPQSALAIAGADSVVLEPGGKHFMVRALTRALVVGETVILRVSFSDGSTLDVACEVRPIGG